MRRTFFILIFFSISIYSFEQNKNFDDSLIYQKIIASTISRSAKTILIVDKTIKYDHFIDTTAIVDSNSIDPNEILQRKLEWESSTGTPFDSIAYRPMMRYYLNQHSPKKINYHYSFPLELLYLSSDRKSEYDHASLSNKYLNFELFEFSEIFYSADRTRAVLYYAVHRKKGKGSIALFQKMNGEWVNKWENIIWYN